jgi:hypothetical protein
LVSLYLSLAKQIAMSFTYYGIANFQATELIGSISGFMNSNQFEYYIIRNFITPENRKPRFQFYIHDAKNLPCVITNNGWFLSSFRSTDYFGKETIMFDFNDPNNNTDEDFAMIFKSDYCRLSTKLGCVLGVGQDAIEAVLNEFLRASHFPNWLEYLKTRHEIILDQKHLQVSEIEKSNQNLTESLQAEVETLKLENKALKEKIEKIKSDISQLLQD